MIPPFGKWTPLTDFSTSSSLLICHREQLQWEWVFLCSYLKAWDSLYTLKVKFLNMNMGQITLHESKVLLTNFAGRCNLEMAFCLGKRRKPRVCVYAVDNFWFSAHKWTIEATTRWRLVIRAWPFPPRSPICALHGIISYAAQLWGNWASWT